MGIFSRPLVWMGKGKTVTEFIYNNLFAIITFSLPPILGGLWYVIEAKVMSRVRKDISPIWKHIDKINQERAVETLGHEKRFTLLESAQSHTQDHMLKLESKLDGIDQKLDQKHSDLNKRLDDWFSRGNRNG